MWFKKEKPIDTPGLPDLPNFPSVQELPETQEESPFIEEKLPALPSLPNSETGNLYGQEAIKAELNMKPEPNITIVAKPYTKEISSRQRKPYVKEISSGQREEVIEKRRMPEIYTRQESQPVFVRIDRFQSSLKNLQEVKKQLMNIEGYLAEIKEIKAKEDEELALWIHELEEIKIKLGYIDSTLFSKVQ